MRKTYDNILFHETGQSIPLSPDDFIEYLIDNLGQLRIEYDRLNSQLDKIRLIVDPKVEF